MTISRRSFLKAGIMGTIFAGIPLKSTNGVHARSTRDKQPARAHGMRTPAEHSIFNSCTKSNFSQYLHTKFLVYRKTGGTEEITLVKVSDLKARPGKRSATMSQAEESFSLMFRGSASKSLEQDVYTVKHEGLGVFDLFLVPVDMPRGAQNYQVIFNRQCA